MSGVLHFDIQVLENYRAAFPSFPEWWPGKLFWKLSCNMLDK